MPQHYCCCVKWIRFISHLHNTYTNTNIYGPLYHTKCRYTKLLITITHTHTHTHTHIHALSNDWTLWPTATKRSILSMQIQEALAINNTTHFIKYRGDNIFRKRTYINICWCIHGTKPAITMNIINLNRPITKVVRSKALTALTTVNTGIVGFNPREVCPQFFCVSV